MASLNKVIVMGNLGGDPELRYTAGGTAVATLSVATTDYRTDKNGERQSQTEWHRIVVWGKTAENCAKFLAKGQGVLVEGRLQTRSWEDQKSGQKRYSTEIVATQVQFLGRRDGKGGEGSTNNYANMDEQPMAAGAGEDAGESFGGGSLDDIPF